MNLLNLHEQRRLDRQFYEITDKDLIISLIDKHLDKGKIQINEFPKEIMANIKTIKSGKCVHLSLNQFLPPDFDIRNWLTVFSVNNRYIEIILEKSYFDGKDGMFDLVKAKIANNFRQNPRININDNHFIIENFQLNQLYINKEVNKNTSLIRETFNSLNLRSKKDFKKCELCDFDKNEKRKEIVAVQKTMKPLYVEDVYRLANKPPFNSDFLDYKSFLGSQLDHEIGVLQAKKIRSLLVIPVIYTNLINEKTLLGCLRMTSPNAVIQPTFVTRLMSIANSLIDKINQKSNVKIKSIQRVSNISRHGLQMDIQNDELAKLISQNPEEIVIDVRPNALFRFSFTGKVMNMYTSDNGHFLAGVNFISCDNKMFDLTNWHKYMDVFHNHEFYKDNVIVK